MQEKNTKIKLPKPYKTHLERQGRVSYMPYDLKITTDGNEFQVEHVMKVNVREIEYWPKAIIAKADSSTLNGLVRKLGIARNETYWELMDQLSTLFNDTLSELDSQHELEEPSISNYLQLESADSNGELSVVRKMYSEAYGNYDIDNIIMCKQWKEVNLEWIVSMRLEFSSQGWKASLFGETGDGRFSTKDSVFSPSLTNLLVRITESSGWIFVNKDIIDNLQPLFFDRIVQMRADWARSIPSFDTFHMQEKEFCRSKKKLSYLRSKYHEAFGEYEVVALPTPYADNDTRAVRLSFSEDGWSGALYGPEDTDPIAYTRQCMSSSELHDVVPGGTYDEWSADFNIRNLVEDMVEDDPRWLPFVLEYLVETETLED